MGWRGHHHIPVFVDPDEREPYWARHHREIDDAQDEWATELAVGEGVRLLPCDPEESDLLPPTVAGLAPYTGAPTRSRRRSCRTEEI